MPNDRLNMKDWMRERWDEVEDAAMAAARIYRGVKPQETAPAPRPASPPLVGGPYIQTRNGIPVPKGPPIRRDEGRISDEEIANIIFNETRSLSGPGIDEARRNIAHAVLNGAEIKGDDRPKTAPTRIQVPEVERDIYNAAANAVAGARYERSKGIDPTDGGVHFNFRPNSSTGPWWGFPLRTQKGPFKNSYPHSDLPNRDGVYANTYQDDD